MASPQSTQSERSKSSHGAAGQSFRLLALPVEIRSMILSLLLVKPLANQPTGQAANVGCIVMTKMAPQSFDWLSSQRSICPTMLWRCSGEYDLTTYGPRVSTSSQTSDGTREPDQRLPAFQTFEINRQLYQEASAIFYSKNMFYFQYSSVALPFLKDRGKRSLSNLRRVSIAFPELLQGRHPRYPEIASSENDELTWENLCCSLSLHVPNLAHLDLRIQRKRLKHKDDEPCKHNPLQSSVDFPLKRRSELATLRPETRISISEASRGGGWFNWSGLASNSGNAFWEPLEPWLEKSIARLRTRNGLGVEVTEVERLRNSKRFWTARRQTHKDCTYIAKRRGPLRDEDHKALDPDGWVDDSIDGPKGLSSQGWKRYSSAL